MFLFLFHHFCFSWFSPFRLGWQGVVGKREVGKERLARQGWKEENGKGEVGALGVEELRLGDESSKGPFAIQFANSKIVDKQRVFRHPPKNNPKMELATYSQHVGKRLAKGRQTVGTKVGQKTSWLVGWLAAGSRRVRGGLAAGVAGAVGDWLGVWRWVCVVAFGWLVFWLAVFTDGL